MARYNRRPSGLIVPSPIVSTPSPTARTGNNAPGFVRDAKSELFLLGVANFFQDTFYEKGKVRDERFVGLIHQVAAEDPGWLARFLIWLRSEANMRTAAIVGAVEFCRAYKVPETSDLRAQDTGLPRLTMRSVIQRADEPGEALGYHLLHYGRKLPMSLKRGVADAAGRLFNEFNTLKYDTASHAIRFGDVLELCHPKPIDGYQTALFPYLLAKRHNRDDISLDGLRMIRDNANLRALAAQQPEHLLLPTNLRAAGMTWEDALSLAGDKVPKKDLWEALIPNMGYMALLRNLRNFDQAGVSDAVAAQVIAKLTNPDQVARSRQLPMRFLSAYRHAPSLRWSYPLEQAMQLSLQNVPQFAGRTLILVDQSPSMFPGFAFSTKNTSEISLADQAKIFGVALALRSEQAKLVQYGGTSEEVDFRPEESLLRIIDRFRQIDSTNTPAAVQRHWDSTFSRVIVITDEQTGPYGGPVFAPVPDNRMAVTFNLGGYKVGHAESGSAYRVTLGGLSDKAFTLLPILEQRAAGHWPF